MRMGLVRGRHKLPVETYVFDAIDDPTDLDKLWDIAEGALKGYKCIDLYVTGLTVATVTVINVCFELGILLHLFHFNPETGEYFQQYTPHRSDVNLF